jgi:hypothetical protein
VANALSDDVSVLLGNGDGTFHAQTRLAAGDQPVSIAIATLNGDQKPDLAVPNLRSRDVSILLGTGDGGFQLQAPVAIGSAGISPGPIAIADLDGDGETDLALIARSADIRRQGFSILLGNGDGTFEAPIPIAAGRHDSIAIGDLNGDASPDLATTSAFGNGFASVLLGNGDGSFEAPVPFAAGSAPASLAIGDLNLDLKPDLAIANSLSNDVSVLLNTTPFSTAAQLAALSAIIDSLQPALPQGFAADLKNKLAEAGAQLVKGKTDNACHKLDEFSQKVSDEANSKEPVLTQGQATVLLDAAAQVEASIGCS